MLIDVILLLILVVCVLSGYRRGLLMSLMSLLVVVICCVGALAAQRTMTPRAVEYLEPKMTEVIRAGIAEQMEQETQKAMEQAGRTELNIGGQSMTLTSLGDLLGKFGLNVEESVTEGTAAMLEPAVEAAARAAAHAVTEKIAGAVIFFAAFLVLYLLLHSVVLAVNVVDRLPVIHTLNRAGGAVTGFLGGLLMMTVAAAVCCQAGLSAVELGPLGKLLVQLAERLL